MLLADYPSIDVERGGETAPERARAIVGYLERAGGRVALRVQEAQPPLQHGHGAIEGKEVAGRDGLGTEEVVEEAVGAGPVVVDLPQVVAGQGAVAAGTLYGVFIGSQVELFRGQGPVLHLPVQAQAAQVVSSLLHPEGEEVGPLEESDLAGAREGEEVPHLVGHGRLVEGAWRLVLVGVCHGITPFVEQDAVAVLRVAAPMGHVVLQPVAVAVHIGTVGVLLLGRLVASGAQRRAVPCLAFQPHLIAAHPRQDAGVVPVLAHHGAQAFHDGVLGREGRGARRHMLLPQAARARQLGRIGYQHLGRGQHAQLVACVVVFVGHHDAVMAAVVEAEGLDGPEPLSVEVDVRGHAELFGIDMVVSVATQVERLAVEQDLAAGKEHLAQAIAAGEDVRRAIGQGEGHARVV